MSRKTREQLQQEAIDRRCAALAEDAGHMGWSAHDYPNCPERRRKRQEQIEFAFDEASQN